MSNTIERGDCFKIWELSRRTVETFDKTIGDLRKIYLTVTIAVATATASFILQSGSSDVTNAMFILGTMVVGYSLIFWGLEIHYHQYLRISAIVAEQAEKELGLEERKMGISLELHHYRYRNEKVQRKINWSNGLLAHLLYSLTAIGAIFAISLVRWNALKGNLSNYVMDGYVCWSLILIGGVVLFYLYLIKGSSKKFEDYIQKHYSSAPTAIGKESKTEEAAPT